MSENEKVRQQLPMEGKQGQPTTRSSAPRATQASSDTGRAPVAGPSTHQEYPPAAQEMRPEAAGGPTPEPERVFQYTRWDDSTVMVRAAMVQFLAGGVIVFWADHPVKEWDNRLVLAVNGAWKDVCEITGTQEESDA